MDPMQQQTHFNHYIDGRFVEPASGEYFETINPYDGQAWGRIARGGAADVDAAVGAARRALEAPAWRGISATQRGKLMLALSALIERDWQAITLVEQRDNGKLTAEVSSAIRYSAEYYRYFGGLADKIQGDVIPSDKPGIFAYTKHEPKGVVAILTPWNSPLSLLAWKLAPALAAGCTVVVKPSEYTSASIGLLARLFAEAGFPPGVFNVVTGFGHEAGAELVNHPDVAHISFTGGEVAGIKIYEAAARQLKTVTLELGGKSPNIVFADADMDQAVKGAISGIFAAAGQTCIAGSRMLLQREIHDEFVERLVAMMRDVRLGDPADAGTQIGPICTRPQFDKVMDYIRIAKEEGATCVLGGRARPDIGAGQFVEPTVFTGVNNRMRIAQEEVFGPVLAVIPFTDREEAVAIANDSKYGLASGVWTQSLETAQFMSDRLKAGTVWINTYRATSFTSPFGGFKRSGIGRESGIEAVNEYLQTKCVWVSSGQDVPNPFVRR
jgi:(Z)-2-((N-methylformamido)methylene)-5-hydroxybutyrolactone dehydrogenase